MFLCLTVGLIRQYQALKCSQQTTDDKKYHGSIVNGLDQGKKSVQEKDGVRSDNSQRQTGVQGTNRGIKYQEYKQGSIPRSDK